MPQKLPFELTVYQLIHEVRKKINYCCYVVTSSQDAF